MGDGSRGGRGRGRGRWAAVALLGALLVLVLGAPASAADPRGVVLIDAFGLPGQMDTRTVTTSIRDLSTVGFDDKTSALRVEGGIAIAAYSDIAYGGDCETFVGTDVNLSDNTVGNNRISSVRIGHSCDGYIGGEAIVRDLMIARGLTAAGATCSPGFERKSPDLNEGTSGGLNLYLCVKWGGRVENTALPTGLRVSSAPAGDEGSARNCSLRGEDDPPITKLVEGKDGIGGDLNEGAATTAIYKHIYLCMLSRPALDAVLSGPLLKDIDFIVGEDDIDRDDIDARCQDRLGVWGDGDPTDLNERVGGKYIYVCWSTVPFVPFEQPDVTPPTITFESITPDPGPTGWRTGQIIVTWSCSDAESGVRSERTTWQSSQDQADQTAFGTCRDVAGNQVSATVSDIDIDNGDPTITFADRTPAANAAGWNNGPVTVTWTCADAASGPVSPTATATLSDEGADQTATGTCTDGLGRTAIASVSGIDIDLTDPTVTWTGVQASYGVLDTVVVGCTPADALSGVASSTCAPVNRSASTFAPGDTSLSASATDAAGNTGSATATIRVVPTTADLCELTRRYLAGSTVKSADSVGRELCKKLSDAAAARTAEQRRTRLTAYSDQVRSQTPKLFTRPQAATLTGFAAAL